MKKLLTLLLLTAAPFSFAQDFGLVINQNFTMTGADNYGYTVSAVPWFAAPLGERADLYLSGSLAADYDNGDWKFLPEFYRFEAVFSPTPDFRLQTGRMHFRESAGFIASGLFDGISVTANIGGGQLNAGVFYTGLLHKRSADITVSPQDKENLMDMDNEVYFASRRILSGINWGITSIFDSDVNFFLSGLCQFDLNDADVTVHSQYLAARFTVPFGINFNTEFGVAVSAIEETDRDFRTALAASAELQWLLQGSLPGLAVLGGRFASGEWNDNFGAFIPVTCEAQGKVLRPVFSGIALVQASYFARPFRTFFTELSAGYFFRTDTVTFTGENLDSSSNSPLLGGEVYLNLSWKPFSDLLFTLGGGMFFPQTGKSFTDDAKTKYRLDLSAVISF